MPVFHNLELLALADIHNLQVVSFVDDGLSPSYFCDYFKTLSSTHAIGRRQATMGNLFVQRRNKVCTISFERPVNYLCDAWHVFLPKYEAWTHFNRP